MFVGFTLGIKGWRVFDPRTRVISVAHDASFDESRRWSQSANGTWSMVPVTPSIQNEVSYPALIVEGLDNDEDNEVPAPTASREKTVADDEEQEGDASNDDVELEEEEEQEQQNDAQDGPVQSRKSLRTIIRPARYRSNAVSKPSKRIINDRDYIMFVSNAVSEMYKEPSSLAEALAGQEAEQWRAAVQSEMDSHAQNGTWILVTPPEGVNILGSQLLFKIKVGADGKATRFKVRLVANGNGQKAWVDFDPDDLYTPLSKIPSVRLVIAIVAKYRWYAAHIDFVTAYLNSKLKEKVYMRPPAGINWGGKVALLLKSLYGLKQSGRSWYDVVDEFFKSLGFQRCHGDYGVYIRISGEGSEAEHVIMALYTDDLIIASNKPEAVEKIKDEIKRNFRITDGGKLHYILGVAVHWSEKEVRLSQSAYAESILARFGMSNCAPARTPMPSVPLRSDERKLNANEHATYRAAVGAALYLATCTRPDLAFALQSLSRHLEKPTATHQAQLVHLLRYIRGTVDYGVSYSVGDHAGLAAWSDADWAGDEQTSRSTSGLLLTYNGGLIEWAARGQEIVALSSTESEYIAMAEATKSVLWARSLLLEVGFEESNPTVLHVDNRGAIALAHNARLHRRTKHIRLRYHFLRECVIDREIAVEAVTTAQQLADGFTKPLGPTKIGKWIAGLRQRLF